jgi:hypothetical protein
LDEAEEVLGMMLVARDEPTKVVEPSEEALDFPASAIAAKRAAILGLSVAALLVRGDEFNPPNRTQALVQLVGIIGFVTDQTLGEGVDETLSEQVFDESDFMGRSARNPDRDRKTVAVCNCHDLGPFSALRLTNTSAPFLAPAKVPSMKHSLRSSFPRWTRSLARSCSAFSIRPSRLHS